MSLTISARGFRNHGKRFRAFLLLSVFLAGFLSQAAAPVQAAQSPNDGWIELAVPLAPGGDVVALAIAPSDSSVMYSLLQGDQEGLRLFSSQDAGQSWLMRHIFSLSAENDFNQLAVDPSEPQTVFASGGTNLQRSLDGGITWEILSQPGDVFAAVSSNLLYAGGKTDSCGFGKVSILARSENGGQSWQSYSLGCLVEVQQIAVLPSQPEVVYLSVLYYSAHTGTVLKSTDGGETWNTLVLPVGGADFQLLIDPDNSQILYASGVYGILKSMDGGETWEQISNKTMGIYHRLALSGGSLYAVEATMSKAPVYRSDDGGASWWVSMTLLPAGTNQLIAEPAQAGRLWAGLLNHGIYWTENGGSSWVEQNSGIQSPTNIDTLAVSPSNPEVFYTAVESPYPGVYKTVDGGQTWSEPLPGFVDLYPDTEQNFRPINSLNPQAASVWYPILEIHKLLIHPLHPEIAWAATSKGIYETLDGCHWNLLLSNGTAVDLTVSPADPDQPYAALYDAQNKFYTVQRRCDKTPLICDWRSNRINLCPINHRYAQGRPVQTTASDHKRSCIFAGS